ncbi:hypothetical protein ACX0HA_08210 [Flavobacterium hauense]
MKIKIFSLIAIIVFAAVGAIIFINVSNDHKECTTVTKKIADTDGNTVTVTEHVCNEKYNQ